MGISSEKAYELLNLPLGAAKDAIENSYKKLANKWHPEKHTSSKHTQEALKKFRQISIAYRKLMNNERDDKDMSLHEMFEQYRQVFHHKNKNNNTNKKSSTHTDTVIKTVKSSTNSSSSNNKQQSNGNKKLINNNNCSNDDASDDENNQMNEDEELDTKLKARSFAIEGNKLAFEGDFKKAIEQFSEAISYDPSDCRFYGNRSYCYDKLGLYDDALKDAEKAIETEPSWPKGYYRKGRALSGLKNYTEAEKAYEKVYEFEGVNEDYELIEELHKVRALQLQEMGFSKTQSENSIKKYHTVQAALESILACSNNDLNSSDLDDNEYDSTNQNYNNNNDYNDDDYYSSNNDDYYYEYDDDDADDSTSNDQYSNQKINTKNQQQQQQQFSNGKNGKIQINGGNGYNNNETNGASNDINNKKYMNALASTSLWVGNVDPKVTDKKLADIFSECGEVTTVRCLPDKYCAFVNFKLKEDAGRAIQRLQGRLVEGQKLLIKYPDNPNTSMLHNINQLTSTNTNNNTNNSSNTKINQITITTNNVPPPPSSSLSSSSSSSSSSNNIKLINGNSQQNGSSNSTTTINSEINNNNNNKKLINDNNHNINNNNNNSNNSNNLIYKNAILSTNSSNKQQQQQQLNTINGNNKQKLNDNNNKTHQQNNNNNNSDHNNNSTINLNNKSKENNINNNNLNSNNNGSSKLTGPVNGNECYFWRTTGCVYADKCRYLHIAKNKGIDKKPWHKTATTSSS